MVQVTSGLPRRRQRARYRRVWFEWISSVFHGTKGERFGRSEFLGLFRSP